MAIQFARARYISRSSSGSAVRSAAYNDRRQRVLNGKTPNQVVAERLKVRRKLVRGRPEGRAGPDNVAKAHVIAEDAKEVSQPDS